MASGSRDGGAVTSAPFVLGVELGAIVAGYDVRRRQVSVDALDIATGEVSRGQIEFTPTAVEEWALGFPRRVIHVAVEACTGWLFVSRALERRGAIVHLAEPVEPARCGVADAAPRLTAPTRNGCGSCCARGGCRRPGYRLSMRASGARAPDCVTRWSPSARAGPSGYAPRCITTALLARPMSCAPWPAVSSSLGSSSRFDARERVTVALGIIDLLARNSPSSSETCARWRAAKLVAGR
jgi:hypothetical protein